MRNDGKTESTSIDNSTYSREETRKLIQLLIEDPNTKLIYFNDSTLLKEFKDNAYGVTVKSCTGHDNHLHVRFKE